MKQLLSLFLFLVPCLAWAQYPSNGNQKITLGEQTSADGLIFRGVAATDTARKPSIDTMAYMVLDTTTNIIWHYKKATSNAWLRVGGSISSGVTGTLPVANGGTGSATKNFVDLTTTQTVNGVKTFINNINFDGTIFVKGSGSAANPTVTVRNDDCGLYSAAVNTLGFTTNGTEAGRISPSRNWLLGVGMTDGDYKLDVNGDTRLTGNARITGAYSSTTASAANLFVDSDGDLLRSTSSIKYKSDVEDYNKGLNEVMKLRPVTYKSINSNSDKIYAGFIAEELSDLKLTELLENNDLGEPDAISYAYMVTLLTKAIQEQQEQITLLKKRLLILENK